MVEIISSLLGLFAKINIKNNAMTCKIKYIYNILTVQGHIQSRLSSGLKIKSVVFRIEDFPIDVPAPYFFITENHIPGIELVEIPTGHIL